MTDEPDHFQHPQLFMHLAKLATSTDLNIELCDSAILASFDCVSFQMWPNSPIFTIAIPVSSHTWGRRKQFLCCKTVMVIFMRNGILSTPCWVSLSGFSQTGMSFQNMSTSYICSRCVNLTRIPQSNMSTLNVLTLYCPNLKWISKSDYLLIWIRIWKEYKKALSFIIHLKLFCRVEILSVT